jgi:hypothetical protein
MISLLEGWIKLPKRLHYPKIGGSKCDRCADIAADIQSAERHGLLSRPSLEGPILFPSE